MLDSLSLDLLPATLAAHGGAPALVGPNVPAGQMSYTDLAAAVAAEAATYDGPRQLVLLEADRTVGSVVRLLGAWAAGNPVLLTGPDGPGEAASFGPNIILRSDGPRQHTREPLPDLHPDLALLLSTSGSTGSAKLVRLSWENVQFNARQIAESLAIRPTDVAATTLPLHYCYGLSVLTSHLAVGASVLLTEASVATECFWDQVTRYSVSTFPGVPHTFDLLERSDFAHRDAPSLRYLTQAGGRMSPEQVRRMADLGRRRGFDLVVMYGQTEATARMAVLPADLAHDHPECIGRPVPGGSFGLREAPEAGEGAGELVFTGRNVMLGYAHERADLARGRTVTELATGDLGRIRPDGLIEITGRQGRFAKVLGLRVDLDRVERLLARRGCAVAAADGGDRVVLGVCTAGRPVDPAEVLTAAAEETGLPATSIAVVTVPEFPRLPSGKMDRCALVRLASQPRGSGRPGTSVDDLCRLMGDALGRPARPTDSFVSLGGDSLSYVEVGLRLESELGRLPAQWHETPLVDLAEAEQVPATPRRGRKVETSVVLRAAAIVAIVGSHANLFTLLGGAHVLLAVAGFNTARFLLTDRPRRERIRRLGMATGRIALPSALFIALVATWTQGLGWRQAALINSLTTTAWAEPAWHYWFIEALVQILLAVTLVLAVPSLDRAERRWPFWFPLALGLLSLLPRYGFFGPEGDQVHRATVVFFLFALGWAAYRARTILERLLVSAVLALTVPGLFGLGVREAAVVLGVLLLVWVPSLRLPRAVARLVGPLASASLWIYLVHWQVYPWFESRSPLVGTMLSLVAGVVAWQLHARVTPILAAGIQTARQWLSNQESRPQAKGIDGDECSRSGAPGRDDQPAHLSAGPARNR